MEHDDDLTGAEAAAPAHGGYKIPALRALSEITASLSSDSDLEDLLERFLGTMVKLAGATAGAVRVVTPDGSHLRLVGTIGLPQEVIEREQYVPLECGICGTAASTHSIESAGASVCRESTALAYFGDACKRVIAIPLRNKGRIMGCTTCSCLEITQYPKTSRCCSTRSANTSAWHSKTPASRAKTSASR